METSLAIDCSVDAPSGEQICCLAYTAGPGILSTELDSEWGAELRSGQFEALD